MLSRLSIWLALVLALGVAPRSDAFWQSRDSNYNVDVVSGSTYVGPGDVFSTSPYAWYSCARAFNAAWASGGGNACLIQRASDNAQCTMKFKSTGFVDLTTTYCNSNTQTVAQFCNATTCRVMTAYDETGNSRDVIQATFGSAPTLTLSSSPTGTLPVITCSGTLLLATSSTFTQIQPLTLSAVVIVTTGGAEGGIVGSGTSSQASIGQSNVANNLEVFAGARLNGSAADDTWHSVEGLANGNGTSSAINVDGTDTTGAASTTGISSAAVRLCRAGGGELIGSIAEAGIWAAATNATNRNAISANQHGTNGYNF